MERRPPKKSQRARRPEVVRDGVDPIIGTALTASLRSVFDGYSSEPVPDRFLDLIDDLERRASPSGNDGVDPDSPETDTDR